MNFEKMFNNHLFKLTIMLINTLTIPQVLSFNVPEYTATDQWDAIELPKSTYNNIYGKKINENLPTEQNVVTYLSSKNSNHNNDDNNIIVNRRIGSGGGSSSSSSGSSGSSRQLNLRHHTSHDKYDDVVFVYNKQDSNGNNDKSYNIKHNYLEAQQQRQQTKTQQQHNAYKAIYNSAINATTEMNSRNDLHAKRQRRELADWLIAPNTRWCGRGNNANNTYNYLGGASSTDKCCRKHDHCKVYINAMSNRYDLFNYRPYTLSHCSCDRRFRTCLKMANDHDAKTIGKLFFNIAQMQCFVLRKERICLQRAADGSCLKEHIKQKAYLRNNKKY
uniref:phospholipase A2 n=1 Tax=Glossina morsitans morsitans TaxID=37546 RepID=A0ABK9N6X0_GLOMM